MNDRVGLALGNEDFCRSGVDSPSMAIRDRNSFGSYPGLETNWGDVGNQELKALKIGKRTRGGPLEPRLGICMQATRPGYSPGFACDVKRSSDRGPS
ncbi:hypothetical protein BHE74_00024398 [Ensete ventricosum]|nr:hypothetical protein BHE74_00024398 [Ensete ventricosum]